MIRRVNFTGRIKIKQDSVKLHVTNQGTSSVSFSCSVNLREYNFPPSAAIYLDIYRGSYIRKRFSLGTVESPIVFIDQKIPEFSNFPLFNFKLYVVDARKAYKLILGKTSALFSIDNGHLETNIPLLPVTFNDKTHQVWKLEHNEGRSVLIINSRIPGIYGKLREDPLFRRTVLPAVLREMLFKLFLIDENFEEDDETDIYRAKWIRFIKDSLNAEEDLETLTSNQDDEDGYDYSYRVAAIERIVEKFSEFHFNSDRSRND